MITVKNVMEEIVFDAIIDVLKDINVCTCKICINDIVAKALNDLPPKYYVTDQGKISQKLESLRVQTEVDVISAVTKAAVLVKRSPRH